MGAVRIRANISPLTGSPGGLMGVERVVDREGETLERQEGWVKRKPKLARRLSAARES